MYLGLIWGSSCRLIVRVFAADFSCHSGHFRDRVLRFLPPPKKTNPRTGIYDFPILWGGGSMAKRKYSEVDRIGIN
jgi:hypothetical protein